MWPEAVPYANNPKYLSNAKFEVISSVSDKLLELSPNSPNPFEFLGSNQNCM